MSDYLASFGWQAALMFLCFITIGACVLIVAFSEFIQNRRIKRIPHQYRFPDYLPYSLRDKK